MKKIYFFPKNQHFYPKFLIARKMNKKFRKNYQIIKKNIVKNSFLVFYIIFLKNKKC